MRTGKKISKQQMNRLKVQEKLRSHGEFDLRANAGHAPKIADQSIPKSLLRIMHFSQTQKMPKRPKVNEFSILTKEDKQCAVNKISLRNHLRHLHRTAMEERDKQKKAEEKEQRVAAKKERVARTKAAQSRKPVKVQELLALNKQWRREERSEKKQLRKLMQREKKGKRGRQEADEEDDFANDLNGYAEVKFGEVAQRPPRLPSIDKVVAKARRRKAMRGNDGGND